MNPGSLASDVIFCEIEEPRIAMSRPQAGVERLITDRERVIRIREHPGAERFGVRRGARTIRGIKTAGNFAESVGGIVLEWHAADDIDFDRVMDQAANSPKPNHDRRRQQGPA